MNNATYIGDVEGPPIADHSIEKRRKARETKKSHGGRDNDCMVDLVNVGFSSHCYHKILENAGSSKQSSSKVLAMRIQHCRLQGYSQQWRERCQTEMTHLINRKHA